MHILLSLFSFFFFKFLLKKKEKESVLQYYFLLDSYIYIYRRETDYKNSVILSTEWNPWNGWKSKNDSYNENERDGIPISRF